MPRNPDGSVDIEAFLERIFGPDHVVRQPGGSVEYAGVPEPTPGPHARTAPRSGLRLLRPAQVRPDLLNVLEALPGVVG